MEIEIAQASRKDKSILRNLLELCQHDYSEFNQADVDEHGLFGYGYLENYWTEEGRHAFLVRVGGKLAGCVLVRKVEDVDAGSAHSMAEFFILRKYRRRGLGRKVAFQIFDMFPSPWSVSQEKGNLPAQTFWRNVISENTQGNYQEIRLENQPETGFIQKFVARKS